MIESVSAERKRQQERMDQPKNYVTKLKKQSTGTCEQSRKRSTPEYSSSSFRNNSRYSDKLTRTSTNFYEMNPPRPLHRAQLKLMEGPCI